MTYRIPVDYYMALQHGRGESLILLSYSRSYHYE